MELDVSGKIPGPNTWAALGAVTATAMKAIKVLPQTALAESYSRARQIATPSYPQQKRTSGCSRELARAAHP